MTTTFWLNDTLIQTDEHPGRLVLDFVRDLRHTGTKEGCKEGDCGACTILIGTLENGAIDYQPVTSCLVPVGEMEGKHVVTIEGLNLEGLTPVQESMVKFGGSQCGYCTPGFIVSMTWFLMEETESPTMDGFQRAISGNLCRCTGYSSINRAGEEIIENVQAIWNAPNRLEALVEADYLPKYFSEMPARLAEIAPEVKPLSVEGDFVFIAGGTDLYVQRGEELPKVNVEILEKYPDLRGIERVDDMFRVGALTTFEAFAQDERIQEMIPNIDHFMFLIASLQIRNRATLGGNIVNASPIGDMTQMLLSLGSTLVLQRDDVTRRVALEDFFQGYKELDKAPDEIVTRIDFPAGTEYTAINFEKVSKRKALDIASVCSGARFETDGNGVIMNANISLGGVAATPLLLRATRTYLHGKPINAETIRGALGVLQAEISPISDIRGSADYKRLLSQNLVIAHFTSLFPEYVDFQQAIA